MANIWRPFDDETEEETSDNEVFPQRIFVLNSFIDNGNGMEMEMDIHGLLLTLPQKSCAKPDVL